jgi:hypothetical protein
MPKPPNKLSADQLGQLIYEIRGQRVMLDSDLAAIYGVETKALNRDVKRNRDRFPKDFMFQISSNEWKNLKYQIGTSSPGRESQALRYQFGTLKIGPGQHRKYLLMCSPSTAPSWLPMFSTASAPCRCRFSSCARF